jgi:hypothetical protein
MNQYDLVLTYGVSDKFSLGYNGTIARYKQKENGKYSEAKNWWGSALYFNFDPTEKLGFTLRSEYFEDNDKINVFGGVPGIKGGSVFANTLSANVRLGSLTLIPEFRLESGSTSIFTNGKGNGSKTAAAALLAAVYSF